MLSQAGLGSVRLLFVGGVGLPAVKLPIVDWFGLPAVIQMSCGGLQTPSLAFGEERRFDLFAFESKLSTLTNQNALPTLLEGRLCPGLDSNQHILANAAT